jgi:hypothetical protein
MAAPAAEKEARRRKERRETGPAARMAMIVIAVVGELRLATLIRPESISPGPASARCSVYPLTGSADISAGCLPNTMNKTTQQRAKMAGGMKNPLQSCRWAFK